MNVYAKVLLACEKCLTPRERYNVLTELQFRTIDKELAKLIDELRGSLYPYADADVQNTFLELPSYVEYFYDKEPLEVNVKYRERFEALKGYCKYKADFSDDAGDDDERYYANCSRGMGD